MADFGKATVDPPVELLHVQSATVTFVADCKCGNVITVHAITNRRMSSKCSKCGNEYQLATLQFSDDGKAQRVQTMFRVDRKAITVPKLVIPGS